MVRKIVVSEHFLKDIALNMTYLLSTVERQQALLTGHGILGLCLNELRIKNIEQCQHILESLKDKLLIRCALCGDGCCVCASGEVHKIPKWAAHCISCDVSIGKIGYHDNYATSKDEAMKMWTELNKELEKIVVIPPIYRNPKSIDLMEDSRIEWANKTFRKLVEAGIMHTEI
jgi:hypothetical protein